MAELSAIASCTMVVAFTVTERTGRPCLGDNRAAFARRGLSGLAGRQWDWIRRINGHDEGRKEERLFLLGDGRIGKVGRREWKALTR